MSDSVLIDGTHQVGILAVQRVLQMLGTTAAPLACGTPAIGDDAKPWGLVHRSAWPLCEGTQLFGRRLVGVLTDRRTAPLWLLRLYITHAYAVWKSEQGPVAEKVPSSVSVTSAPWDFHLLLIGPASSALPLQESPYSPQVLPLLHDHGLRCDALSRMVEGCPVVTTFLGCLWELAHRMKDMVVDPRYWHFLNRLLPVLEHQFEWQELGNDVELCRQTRRSLEGEDARTIERMWNTGLRRRWEQLDAACSRAAADLRKLEILPA